MTANKHLKHLVRTRMAATGESYTQAGERLRTVLTDVRLDEPMTVEVHGKHGQTVAFTADGTRLLSGGQDARIAILDPRTGAVTGTMTGHEKVVNAIAIDAGGSRVVSVSSDRTVRIWDLRTGRQLAVLEGHRDAVIAVALTPDATQAITAGYDGRLRRWRLDDGECIDEQRSPLKRIAAVAVTPDGNHTLESGQGPLVLVRDLTGAVVTELDTGAPGVTGLTVAPDGALMATAGYDGTVGMWSCDDWESVREIPAGGQVNAVAFSHDGQLLAAAAAGRLVIWSDRDEEPVASYRLPIKGVYALAFSADTRRLAQTGADGKVRIFELRTHHR
jgi:WD40 repeat protein